MATRGKRVCGNNRLKINDYGDTSDNKYVSSNESCTDKEDDDVVEV